MQHKTTSASGEGNSVSPQLDSMTTVQSINVGLGLSDYSSDATTPTTPRAPIPPPSHPIQHASTEISMSSAPTTPTRLSFGGMTAQRPLPTSPFRNSFSTPNQSATEQQSVESDRPVSQHSVDTNASQDVAMDDSDGEGDAGSDVEGFDAEGGGGSKKKKGQRFFCTDFPPCKLSFTRSEHLARHIRKHTGERPFQCHCSRRFSRLDNLRQHAQTVHVNEEIPMDSLAATGTRFQRQIRTDRVARPAGSRSRASTAGSQGSHPRGHGRNLSTSSIGSTASTISRDDSRKRPPPLIMANDPSRARLSLDVLRTQPSTPPGQTSFFRDSSEGVSTPTSTTYSTGQNSPGYGSSLGSPVSTGRSSGYWENRGHSRRLSVPSGPKPFQSPQGHLHGGSPYLSPLASSQASGFSNLSSSFGSPINESHRFVTREAAEAELRRRTWHPTPHNYTNFSRPGISGASFSRPATSGLSYYQTPDAPHPSYASNATAAASGSQTLPGIASFDPPPQPATPPPRGPSPMQIDQSAQPATLAGRQLEPRTGPAKGHASWDMSLHQNLTRLDIRGNPLPQEPQAWSQPPLRPYEAGRTTAAAPQQPPPPPPQMAPVIHQDGSQRSGDRLDHSGASAARAKRQGWYAGPPLNPVTSHPRVSPGESTGSEGVPKTPSTPAADHDLSIRHSNGFVESIPRQSEPAATRHVFTGDKPQQQSWPLPSSGSTQQYDQVKDTEMSGLDVLVAAATREENAAPRA